ncbi:hypothetical protein SDC9_191703 [bioreactor metagenome]|uniref:Uncharacterized protein n=1 Tax=bioreactor metagenome TaxID=1076179 RepID=A0A645I074_9ZZZZ
MIEKPIHLTFPHSQSVRLQQENWIGKFLGRRRSCQGISFPNADAGRLDIESHIPYTDQIGPLPIQRIGSSICSPENDHWTVDVLLELEYQLVEKILTPGVFLLTCIHHEHQTPRVFVEYGAQPKLSDQALDEPHDPDCVHAGFQRDMVIGVSLLANQ